MKAAQPSFDSGATKRQWFALLMMALPATLWGDALQEHLDPMEIQEVKARLKAFYQNPEDPNGINAIPKKYDPVAKQFVIRNTQLKLKPGQQVPKGQAQALLQQAQVKALDKFQEHQCKTFLDKKFPKLGCKNPEGKASAEANDSITDLTATWIPDDKVIYDLDKVKVSGRSKLKLWSDDYWMIKYGITSYRYSERKNFSKYKEAVSDYAQPKEWNALPTSPASRLTKAVAEWSPAEKYDITVGDTEFKLTNQQKEEGASLLNEDDDVEEWMGICHGWAPAAFMVPRPEKTVTVKGADGVSVTWYPHDIRSMASLAWANGETTTNFVGGRCNVKKVSLLKNGRIAQQECFDNNPSTFHLALANLIGEKNVSFVMDKTFDYEVWNQPVQGYEFVYFNPLNPEETSKDWKEVAVDYDAKFKKQDRFQKPLTRGKRNGSHYDDKGIKKVVGVIASVSYLVEVAPKTGAANENAVQRVTYTYDLELHAEDDHYVALGGEWHTNDHPDFLWVPAKSEVASTSYDKARVTYSGAKPSEKLTSTAQEASRSEGYPLCKVLSYLVKESSGEEYACE